MFHKMSERDTDEMEKSTSNKTDYTTAALLILIIII